MRLLGLLAVLALLSCHGESDDSAATTPDEPAAPQADETAAAPARADSERGATAAAQQPQPAAEPSQTQALMRGHFEQATQAREALLRADVASAKKAMDWLATHPLGEVLPQQLQPQFAAMQASAAEFDEASTLREAGVALARTLTKCGDCHRAAGKEPKFAVPPLPEGDDTAHHMQRHHWAADRMWEGLVRSDPEAFQQAADALADGPHDLAALAPAQSKETTAKLAEHLHELAAKAKSASDFDERAEAYGNFLATCATCHRLLGRGPKPLEEE